MKTMMSAVLLLGVAGMTAAGAVEIDEWTVPWPDTRPRDPDVADAQASKVWFVGQGDDYIAVLDTASGDMKRFDLDEGAGPHNLILDEGKVWYAGNRDAHIGRFDPATETFHRIDMPDGHPQDPHTLIAGDDRYLWFTAQGANVVGRLDRQTEQVEVIEVPTDRARPYGIVLDEDGRPWVAMVGTWKLATIDPATLELKEIELPRADARPRRIAVGSDGGIWYVDYAGGHLGRYDPDTGNIREWQSPYGAQARPYAMAADDAGHIWYVETAPQPNRLVGFDIESETFFDITEIESGAGTVRHMVFHEPTDTLWFGTDANTIGRAQLENDSEG